MRIAVCLILVAITTSVLAEAPPSLAKQFDKLVAPYLDAQIANAISVGVVQGDQSWTRHYGRLSDKISAKPNDQTLYEIGSISKVFTGILLADAVTSGRMKLNQPIGELVPALMENADVGPVIQPRHLATHVSGLPRMPINMQPADIENPYADYDREMMLKFLGSIKPIRKPGEKSEYSNLAVGLLGQILAIEAKQRYEALLKEKLTEPLGMSATTVQLSDEQQPKLAPPHDADRNLTKNWDLNAFVGAGGIRSNTTDMVAFIQANLDPPDNQIGKAIELAWREHCRRRTEPLQWAWAGTSPVTVRLAGTMARLVATTPCCTSIADSRRDWSCCATQQPVKSIRWLNR